MRYAVLVINKHHITEDGVPHCELYKNRLSKLPVVFSSENSIEEKMKEEFITDYRTVCIGV
jgi:hypothetical protein